MGVLFRRIEDKGTVGGKECRLRGGGGGSMGNKRACLWHPDAGSFVFALRSLFVLMAHLGGTFIELTPSSLKCVLWDRVKGGRGM